MAMVAFLLCLSICLIMDISVLYAMLLGYVCFFLQGLWTGYKPKDIFDFSRAGAAKSKNILVLFVFIGMLTGIWRAGGTIPYIVYISVDWISPRFFVLSAFLLTSMLSALIGTAFGTVSIMGTILMLLAELNGVDGNMVGGAVLAGAYFGDRCSPMSSSARLVCDITNTDYYENIGMWLQTSAIPFALAIAGYVVFCRTEMVSGIHTDFLRDFHSYFRLSGILVLPAVALLILAVLKVNVRLNMMISVFLACMLCLFVQRCTFVDIISSLVIGYDPKTAGELANMLGGGGIISMFRAGLIILIASSYIGIFEGTGMLGGVEAFSNRLSLRIGEYATSLFSGIISSCIACNQTLAILMTHQVCRDNYSKDKRLALDIVNTVVPISGVVPWNIACAVPLAIMNVNNDAVGYAFFLFLLPLWNFMIAKVLGK